MSGDEELEGRGKGWEHFYKGMFTDNENTTNFDEGPQIQGQNSYRPHISEKVPLVLEQKIYSPKVPKILKEIYRYKDVIVLE